MEIPVYLFTGFLESGKTKFIQETLEDVKFNNGERMLLLVFEEGMEEYDPSMFSGNNISIEIIDDKNDTYYVVGQSNLYGVLDKNYTKDEVKVSDEKSYEIQMTATSVSFVTVIKKLNIKIL